MKIRYFGTAAAEGIPAFGCNCRVCENARKVGGKEFRLRCQALINDDLLIDFPPDSMYYSMKYGVDYSKIKACLISHNHADHLCAKELIYFGKNYVATERQNPIEFYSEHSGYYAIKEVLNSNLKGRVNLNLAEKFKSFSVAGYNVLPLPARHGEHTTPVIYLIEKDGKKLLWAHDTGEFKEETFSALKEAGRIDYISLDCCAVFKPDWRAHHLGIDTCFETLERLIKDGVIDGKTVKVFSHFSHNGNGTQKEMEEYLKDKNIIVAYDGMEIEF